MSLRSHRWRRLVALTVLFALVAGFVQPGPGGIDRPALAAGPIASSPAQQQTAEEYAQARFDTLLAQAQTALTVAQQRLEQAQTGRGGAGARPEDVAMAEADLKAARAALRLQQPFADVRAYQGSVHLYDGLAKGLKEFHDACGELEVHTTVEVGGVKDAIQAKSQPSCPDDQSDSLQATSDAWVAMRQKAELELKRHTDPASTIKNYLAPYEQAVRKAELAIQKLKTGSSTDLATLELNVAVAQADVDKILAAKTGSMPGQLQAQVRAYRAILANAQYRLQQAKDGQGGADARPEDIGQAEADVKARQADLDLLLNPLSEDIGQARAAVDSFEALVRSARESADACGHGRTTTRVSADPGAADDTPVQVPGVTLPPIVVGDVIVDIPSIGGYLLEEFVNGTEVVADQTCTGDQRRALEAGIDKSEAQLVVARQQLKLLTDPDQKNFQYKVGQRRQALLAAQSRLQKLKTGGSSEQRTLELNVTRAQINLDSIEALLADSQADYDRHQLRGAQATLAEAEYRIAQARAGQGGADARSEDIAAAEADLAAARALVQQLLNPSSELIRIARAAVEAADAGFRQAKLTRDGCDAEVSVTTTKINGKTQDIKAFAERRCSGVWKDALEASQDIARIDRESAQLNVKLLTDPSEQTLRNRVGSAQQAVVVAQARLQKLKTGGSSDEATLELNRAIAQAGVDFWQAAVAGSSPRTRVEAQIRAARAIVTEAEFRQQQALSGQARAEDVTIAEAALEIARIQLQTLIDPTPETLQQARLAVARGDAGVRLATKQRAACDDPRTTSVSKENRDDPDPNTRSDSQIHCPNDLTDALDADIDRAKAQLTAAENELTFLTDPSPAQFAHLAEPLRQGVVAAEARLQKVKTGGAYDSVALDFGIVTAQSEVDRLLRVIDGDLPGELQVLFVQAEAAVRNAEYRQDQAASGLGGPGVRIEDLAIGQAELIAAKERYQGATDLPPEKIAVLQAGVDGAAAALRAAKHLRDACGNVKTITVTKVNGREDSRSITNPNCSDASQSVNDEAVKAAELNLEIAQQQLKLATAPAQPQLDNSLTPFRSDVDSATARLQKLQTGGPVDQLGLEDFVAVNAQGPPIWGNLLQGNVPGQIEAQLAYAKHALNSAQVRKQQAASGQGGAQARAEDITMASADLSTSQASLSLLLRPFQESVRIAQLGVAVNDSGVRHARFVRKACEEIRMSVETRDLSHEHEGDDNDNGDDNSNDNDAYDDDAAVKVRIECPEDLQDGIGDIADGIKGFGLVPQFNLSLLTETETNEQAQTAVASARAAVEKQQALVQKLKTGGPDDTIALDMDIALGMARVRCREVLLDGQIQVKFGAPQSPPFARITQMQNACGVDQVPGWIPPFTQTDVRVPK